MKRKKRRRPSEREREQSDERKRLCFSLLLRSIRRAPRPFSSNKAASRSRTSHPSGAFRHALGPGRQRSTKASSYGTATARRNPREKKETNFLLYAPHRRRRLALYLRHHRRPRPGRGRAQQRGRGDGGAAHASSAERRGHGGFVEEEGERGAERGAEIAF